eukprot:TRINITY_DN26776_c0_g1_i1.p1 TRINITY_DN26776_c0_g1~~TRINITY_DN26776_c0_g1_i1.p1  ORF type:complete len:503 (+),score=107.62 TRINITY_DN26776_c0_g1_i1:133-1641(+)
MSSSEAVRPSSSLRRSRTFGEDGPRALCRYGSECYRRNEQHLREVAHPWDTDYLEICRQTKVDPNIISVRKLFDWCDNIGTGHVTKKQMGEKWELIQELTAKDIGCFTDDVWTGLDDDGNGYINFSEFAEWTTANEITLPLGLDDLFDGLNSDMGMKLRCGVHSCMCEDFQVGRRRCKYGADCYQKNEAHLGSFCHPNDPDWEANCKGDGNMCSCGHKRKLHASAATGVCSVPYPVYWKNQAGGSNANDEFNTLVSVPEMIGKFSQLVDHTYSDVTTRDRVNHSGSWMVPRDFKVVDVMRNENSKLWRKYCVRKAELQKERQMALDDPEAEAKGGLPKYEAYEDVLTSKKWAEIDKHESLDPGVNEWYLFHGTSASAAVNICKKDFKMRLAGSATGTLYGRGSYFAESVTKSDEYSKSEDGCHTVILCRVLGGRVRYTAERTPDPDELTKDCVEGPYDCIVGDRKKVSGTYREFIVFDTENVYPEYILKYKRGELFKSPSHP